MKATNSIYQKVHEEHIFRSILSENQQTYVLFTNASTKNKYLKPTKHNSIISAFKDIHPVEFARPPFLHVNCDISFENRHLQPICRKYFKDYEGLNWPTGLWDFDDIQISKFKSNSTGSVIPHSESTRDPENYDKLKNQPIQHFDHFDGKRWPLTLQTLRLFFQDNDFKKAPIGQRLHRYQQIAINKYKKHSLHFIDDPHVAWAEIHKRGKNNVPSFLIFYDHSKSHFKTYQSLETEMEAVLEKVYVEDKFDILGMSMGLFFFDLTRCDEFPKCRQIRNYFKIFYSNCVLIAKMPDDIKLLPLNVEMQYSGSAFRKNDILNIFEDFHVSFKDKTPLIWYPDERLRDRDLVYNPALFKKIDIRKFDPRDYENVIIFYTANYCIHCHDMKAKFEEVARAVQKKIRKVTFLHVKTDAKMVKKVSLDGGVNGVWDGDKTHDYIVNDMRLPFEGFPSVYAFGGGGRRREQISGVNLIWMKSAGEMVSGLLEFLR